MNTNRTNGSKLTILTEKLLAERKIANISANALAPEDFPYNIEVIAENLEIPWAVAVSGDGRIFFTERTGTVRVIDEGILLPEPVIAFGAPFISEGEGGLMGIVLDPEFRQNHYLYVMHTYSEGGRSDNRVVRLVEQDNRAILDRIILDRIPGGQIHNGGRIKIGPDRKLYITTGDAGDAGLAQDLTSTAGKILRVELDGSIPADNPFANSPVFSYGHRNPQGLAWNMDNVLYASEHGATARDEINIIRPGGNYGWPVIEGGEEAGGLITPLLNSGQVTWAPSGIAFVTEGPWQGRLLAAALRGERLITLTLNSNGTQVEEIEEWLHNELGRLREVVRAEDGSLYILTNNTDGRGNPDCTDDKLLRLIPKNLRR